MDWREEGWWWWWVRVTTTTTPSHFSSIASKVVPPLRLERSSGASSSVTLLLTVYFESLGASLGFLYVSPENHFRVVQVGAQTHSSRHGDTRLAPSEIEDPFTDVWDFADWFFGDAKWTPNVFILARLGSSSFRGLLFCIEDFQRNRFLFFSFFSFLGNTQVVVVAVVVEKEEATKTHRGIGREGDCRKAIRNKNKPWRSITLGRISPTPPAPVPLSHHFETLVLLSFF